MTKREPKDYEVWYVMLSDGSIKPAVAWIPPNPENTVWYIDGDSCCADPIAPVISHELARELVVALDDLECEASQIDANTPLNICVNNARKVLAKAKLAGLEE